MIAPLWTKVQSRLVREITTRRAALVDGANCSIDDRRQLFEEVLRHVDEPLDYLEFGVAEGRSLRWWQEHLSDQSRLFGFDSFRGLPEDWRKDHPKGTFDRGGQPPDIQAPNLRFVVGWFEETLEPWLLRTRLNPRLVVYVDADLYRPTRHVLECLQEHLTPTTITIFDEYWDLNHEYRAVREFCRESGKGFQYLAISRRAPRVAMRWL